MGHRKVFKMLMCHCQSGQCNWTPLSAWRRKEVPFYAASSKRREHAGRWKNKMNIDFFFSVNHDNYTVHIKNESYDSSDLKAFIRDRLYLTNLESCKSCSIRDFYVGSGSLNPIKYLLD